MLDREGREVRIVDQVAGGPRRHEQRAHERAVARRRLDDHGSRARRPRLDPIEGALDRSGRENKLALVTSLTKTKIAIRENPTIASPESDRSSHARASW